MKTFFSSWYGTVLFAALAMFAFALLIGTVADTLAGGALAASSPWHVHLYQVEEALGRQDLPAALGHWRGAYAAALGSRQWPGLVETGVAYRRLGERGGFASAADAKARKLYLLALLRARAAGSLEGVLQATEAFLDLGDSEMVEQGLHISRAVVDRDPDPRGSERVAMLAARCRARLLGTGSSARNGR